MVSMDKKLKNVYKEIINNKKLKDNIPLFLNMTANKFYTAAGVKLALNYFTFYEMYCDDGNLWSLNLKEYFDKVNGIISHLGNNEANDKYKDYVNELDEIRNGITARMDCLTYYADLFELYEYALNRVEYRFKDMEPLEDDEEFARKLLKFIFDSKDNVVINETIKEVISQLPVRITKQKYFEYLKEGFSELIGAKEDSFRTHIYLVRSAALLDFPFDGKDIYPDLWDKKVQLEKLDFKNITKEEYDSATDLLSDAVTFLEIETTAYFSLMELVNELYALIICTPFAKDDSSDDTEKRDAVFNIINEINKAYFGNQSDEISGDVIERFKSLEGFQEDTEFDLLKLDDALFHINEQHRTLTLNISEDNLLDTLLMSKDLLSDSRFIDLHKKRSDESISIENYQNEVNRLIEDLTVKFQSCDRIIMRAIMAKTIYYLPVFFNSHSEVMNYVLYSLNKCTDLAEKYACVEILNEIMSY